MESSPGTASKTTEKENEQYPSPISAGKPVICSLKTGGENEKPNRRNGPEEAIFLMRYGRVANNEKERYEREPPLAQQAKRDEDKAKQRSSAGEELRGPFHMFVPRRNSEGC